MAESYNFTCARQTTDSRGCRFRRHRPDRRRRADVPGAIRRRRARGPVLPLPTGRTTAGAGLVTASRAPSGGSPGHPKTPPAFRDRTRDPSRLNVRCQTGSGRLDRHAAPYENPVLVSWRRTAVKARTARLRRSGAGRRGPRKRLSRGSGRSPVWFGAPLEGAVPPSGR